MNENQVHMTKLLELVVDIQISDATADMGESHWPCKK